MKKHVNKRTILSGILAMILALFMFCGGTVYAEEAGAGSSGATAGDLLQDNGDFESLENSAETGLYPMTIGTYWRLRNTTTYNTIAKVVDRTQIDHRQAVSI